MCLAKSVKKFLPVTTPMHLSEKSGVPKRGFQVTWMSTENSALSPTSSKPEFVHTVQDIISILHTGDSLLLMQKSIKIDHALCAWLHLFQRGPFFPTMTVAFSLAKTLPSGRKWGTVCRKTIVLTRNQKDSASWQWRQQISSSMLINLGLFYLRCR